MTNHRKYAIFSDRSPSLLYHIHGAASSVFYVGGLAFFGPALHFMLDGASPFWYNTGTNERKYPMKTITLSEFNSIPEFFYNGVLSIEIDGIAYAKNGVFKMLRLMGLIDMTK